MLGIVKTRTEIANEYGIDRKTLYRWLKNKNIVLSGNLVNPKEQDLIYENFGIPKFFTKDEREYYSKRLTKR